MPWQFSGIWGWAVLVRILLALPRFACRIACRPVSSAQEKRIHPNVELGSFALYGSSSLVRRRPQSGTCVRGVVGGDMGIYVESRLFFYGVSAVCSQQEWQFRGTYLHSFSKRCLFHPKSVKLSLHFCEIWSSTCDTCDFTCFHFFVNLLSYWTVRAPIGTQCGDCHLVLPIQGTRWHVKSVSSKISETSRVYILCENVVRINSSDRFCILLCASCHWGFCCLQSARVTVPWRIFAQFLKTVSVSSAISETELAFLWNLIIQMRYMRFHLFSFLWTCINGNTERGNWSCSTNPGHKLKYWKWPLGLTRGSCDILLLEICKATRWRWSGSGQVSQNLKNPHEFNTIHVKILVIKLRPRSVPS